MLQPSAPPWPDPALFGPWAVDAAYDANDSIEPPAASPATTAEPAALVSAGMAAAAPDPDRVDAGPVTVSTELGEAVGTSASVALSPDAASADLDASVAVEGVAGAEVGTTIELGAAGVGAEVGADLELLGGEPIEAGVALEVSPDGVALGVELGEATIAVELPLALPPLLPPGDDPPEDSGGGLLGGLFGH